jgi:hypothetical protein
VSTTVMVSPFVRARERTANFKSFKKLIILHLSIHLLAGQFKWLWTSRTLAKNGDVGI